MIKSLLCFIYEFLIPHFIEEWVMLEEKEDGYHPVCSHLDLRDGEVFDAMCKSRAITWFGMAFMPRFGQPVEFDLNELCK